MTRKHYVNAVEDEDEAGGHKGFEEGKVSDTSASNSLRTPNLPASVLQEYFLD